MSEWAIPNEFDLPKGEELRELAGGDINPLQFDPPGPVGEAFIFGSDPIDFIMGPAGSAKTVCSIFRLVTTTLRFPVCKDGVIRTRIPIVRENFRVLYRTTLPSLFRFFPRDFPGAKFEGGQDRPFNFTLRFVTPRGRKVQLILDGFGIGDHAIEELLRGYEPSAAWLNEADMLDRKVPPFMFGRVAQNRYPGRALLADEAAPMPKTIWGDLNPPLITHWIKEDFEDNPRPGYRLRRQPSGLSEQAENRRYVPRDTYEAMAKTMDADTVRRMVHGEFGLTGEGALVYPEFNYAKHVSDKVEPLDLPLRIGVDAGGSPAAVLFQYSPTGKLRVLDELASAAGTGVGRFGEMLVDLIQARYRGLRLEIGWGDPSAFHGADRVAGELAFMEILARTLNILILPTETNDPHMRRQAVRWFLAHPGDDSNVPFFAMHARCKVLAGGFQGGFVLHVNPHDSIERIRFLKNKFSHPHEGLQYGAYGSRGHAGIINDAARAGRPGNGAPPPASVAIKSEFNVL